MVLDRGGLLERLRCHLGFLSVRLMRKTRRHLLLLLVILVSSLFCAVLGILCERWKCGGDRRVSIVLRERVDGELDVRWQVEVVQWIWAVVIAKCQDKDSGQSVGVSVQSSAVDIRVVNGGLRVAVSGQSH